LQYKKYPIMSAAGSTQRVSRISTTEHKKVNCKEMVCSQLVLSGDSITEQPFAPVAAVSHWLTPACSRITSFTDYVFSGLFNFGCNASDNSCISPLVQLPLYLHSVGKLQPHCNKVYKRFAMRKNKFMGSNK
ncbi:hypothetical protein ACJX0J_031754, partial [Zea mays]